MELRPESVLEVGCARGYVLRRLEDAGVQVRGLEVSEHCRLTRATDAVETWDATETPWPVGDGEFDLCLSVAFLEHVPEEKLPAVLAEMARTCRRGLHGIDLHDEDGFDKTHVSIHDLAWWRERLPAGQVGVDKESLEAGPADPPRDAGGLVKLNLGCGANMVHFGWRNFDRPDPGLETRARQHGYSLVQHDVRDGLPLDDGVVDLIFADHLLDALSYEEGARLLAECRRVLRPGGALRASVVDFGGLVRRYEGGALRDLDELLGGAPASRIERLHRLLPRGALYDGPEFVRALSGFREVRAAHFRDGSAIAREVTDTLPDLSLIAEAVR